MSNALRITSSIIPTPLAMLFCKFSSRGDAVSGGVFPQCLAPARAVSVTRFSNEMSFSDYNHIIRLLGMRGRKSGNYRIPECNTDSWALPWEACACLYLSVGPNSIHHANEQSCLLACLLWPLGTVDIAAMVFNMRCWLSCARIERGFQSLSRRRVQDGWAGDWAIYQFAVKVNDLHAGRCIRGLPDSPRFLQNVSG